MTDKELLELAAKAAGIKGLVFNEDTLEWVIRNESFTSKGNRTYSVTVWNPLTNDGDALRLAVKLSLNVCSDDENSITGVVDASEKHCVFEKHNNDLYAATRRAIVRAAADIGRI